jgi:multiple sugar transport system substrate-binding protein
MAEISRRQFAAFAVAGVGSALALSACSSGGAQTAAGSGTSDAYTKASLAFAWWGNDVRNAYTAKIIANYQAAHPAITIAAQPGEWASYWTKLSTQVAGNTAPDLIQMDQAYIAEYGGRGALLDLSKVSTFDTGNIDKDAIKSGTYDGKLYGISTGQNAYCVIANPALFTEAGVELPDDKTWTWDDYQSIAGKISKASNGSVRGTSWAGADADLQLWLHQHAEQLYTSKGKLGYKLATVTSWLDYVKKLFSSGAGPSADVFTQDIGAALEQTTFGTKKAAMGWQYTNQLAAMEAAVGGEVKLLRVPSLKGSAAENGMYYKPSMFWSASARTKFPQQTGALINYFTNNVSAGKLQLAERGIPVDPKVLDAIKSQFAPADKIGLEFLDDIKKDIKWVPPVPPTGTSTGGAVIQRHLEDVVFGRASSSAAAKAMHTELEGLLQS